MLWGGRSSRSPALRTRSRSTRRRESRSSGIHRGGRADPVGDDLAGDNAPLVAAVRSAPWLPGQAQVFIHGEAQAVM